MDVIHVRVQRYLRRQSPRIRRAFAEAIEHISGGPFPSDDPAHIDHLRGPFLCSYRYVLRGGRRGLRIKYDVDADSRTISIYDLGPRGGAYE